MGIRETSRIDYWGGRKKSLDPNFRWFEVLALDPIYQTKFKLYMVVAKSATHRIKDELRRKGYKYIRSVPSTEDKDNRAIYYALKKAQGGRR